MTLQGVKKIFFLKRAHKKIFFYTHVILFVKFPSSVFAVPFPRWFGVRRRLVYALARYVHAQLYLCVGLAIGVPVVIRNNFLFQFSKQLAVFVH